MRNFLHDGVALLSLCNATIIGFSLPLLAVIYSLQSGSKRDSMCSFLTKILPKIPNLYVFYCANCSLHTVWLTEPFMSWNDLSFLLRVCSLATTTNNPNSGSSPSPTRRLLRNSSCSPVTHRTCLGHVRWRVQCDNLYRTPSVKREWKK